MVLSVFQESNLLNLISLGAFLGAAFIIARQRGAASLLDTAERRASDWRDTAEQRQATITDRDRTIAELTTRMERMAELQRSMKEQIDRLEREIAELRRYDVASVSILIKQLGIDMSGRFDSLDQHFPSD